MVSSPSREGPSFKALSGVPCLSREPPLLGDGEPKQDKKSSGILALCTFGCRASGESSSWVISTYLVRGTYSSKDEAWTKGMPNLLELKGCLALAQHGMHVRLLKLNLYRGGTAGEENSTSILAGYPTDYAHEGPLDRILS